MLLLISFAPFLMYCNDLTVFCVPYLQPIELERKETKPLTAREKLILGIE